MINMIKTNSIDEITNILNDKNVIFVSFEGSKKRIFFFVENKSISFVGCECIKLELPENHDYKKIHETFLKNNFFILSFRYIHVNKYEDYYNVEYANGKHSFSYSISKPSDLHFRPGLIFINSNAAKVLIRECEKPVLELVNRLNYTDRIEWFLLLEKSANKLKFKFYDTEFSKYNEIEKLYGKLMLL